MSYDKLFIKGRGTIIHSPAVSIIRSTNGAGGKVTTEDGVEHPYTILVIATGSSFEGPLEFPSSRAEAIQHVNGWREKFKQCKGVAIIGGGAVGCELAGEIRDSYPDKRITIVQKEEHLLIPAYPDKYRIDVEKRWRQRKINLILNDLVNNIPEFPSPEILTTGGKRIEADLIIPARGGRPNTAIAQNLGAGVLTASGYIKVEDTLLVKGFPDIFAAGDVIDWNEVKQVAKYPGHATTIVANIRNILDGKHPAATYKSMFEVIALTNGAGGGAVYMNTLWGLCFGNTFAKMIKAKDLFITKTSQGLGIA